MPAQGRRPLGARRRDKADDTHAGVSRRPYPTNETARETRLRAAYEICLWLIAALGCAHLAFAFHDYDEFSLGAMWYAGSGLALVFAGFLNDAHPRGGGATASCARSPF